MRGWMNWNRKKAIEEEGRRQQPGRGYIRWCWCSFLSNIDERAGRAGNEAQASVESGSALGKGTLLGMGDSMGV